MGSLIKHSGFLIPTFQRLIASKVGPLSYKFKSLVSHVSTHKILFYPRNGRWGAKKGRWWRRNSKLLGSLIFNTSTHPNVPCIAIGSPQGYSVEWDRVLFGVH